MYKIVDWNWSETTLTYNNASINALWNSLGNSCAAGQWVEVDVTAAVTGDRCRWARKSQVARLEVVSRPAVPAAT